MWPIFVISLPDAAARRQAVTARLSDIGLEGTFIDAVDGRNGLPADLETRIDRVSAKAHFHRDLSDAEFACAMSHRRVYQHILDQGLEGAVVLEDDAVPQPGFKEFLRDEGYKTAELILFDHQGAFYLPWSKVHRRRLGALAGRPRLVLADEKIPSDTEVTRKAVIENSASRWRIIGPPTRGDF